jgi:hypothetical protein
MISLFLFSSAVLFGITVVGDMFSKRNNTGSRSRRNKYYRH